MQQLSSRKASRSDTIPAAIYEHISSKLIEHLTALFQEMGFLGPVPSEFQGRHHRSLRGEGEPPNLRQPQRHLPPQHRRKDFPHPHQRLHSHLGQGLLPESQYGFRRRRETTEMIIAARQLQEKCQEMRIHLYSTLVDLAKALDKRVSTTAVHELIFADNWALNATTEGDIQRSMGLFAAACDNCSLIIKTEKTLDMSQTPPNAAHNAPQISVNGAQLQAVDNFTCLGSTLSRNAKIRDEVACQISKLSPTDIEAKVAGPDLEHGRTATDENSEHPRHPETIATALERPPGAD
ncbi:hypothetical protein SprV_0200685900 [Sparganum proliferum]